MLVLPISYFAYNFLIGSALIFFYLYTERKIVGWAEFFLLLFLPVIGLGYWLFRRQNRTVSGENLPLVWHILHKLSLIHAGYMLVLLSFGAWVFGIFSNYIGSGSDWASHQNNATAQGLGLLTDFGIFLISVFGLFLYLFLLLIFGLFLVVAPYFIAFLFKRKDDEGEDNDEKLQEII